MRRIRIEAEDDCGNVSTLEFAVRGRTGEFRAEADTTAVTLRPDRASVLRVGREAEVRIPEGTIYEPIFVRPGLGEAPQADSGVVVLSPAYRFFDPATPLFRAVEVTLRGSVPRPLQLRAQLAVRTRRGSLACVGGAYADGAVTASVRTAGDLAIVADTLPPAIRPLFAEGADLTRAEGVRFRAADNFSGIASWRLHIDGKWERWFISSTRRRSGAPTPCVFRSPTDAETQRISKEHFTVDERRFWKKFPIFAGTAT